MSSWILFFNIADAEPHGLSLFTFSLVMALWGDSFHILNDGRFLWVCKITCPYIKRDGRPCARGSIFFLAFSLSLFHSLFHSLFVPCIRIGSIIFTADSGVATFSVDFWTVSKLPCRQKSTFSSINDFTIPARNSDANEMHEREKKRDHTGLYDRAEDPSVDRP